jgi:hypothetical protein
MLHHAPHKAVWQSDSSSIRGRCKCALLVSKNFLPSFRSDDFAESFINSLFFFEEIEFCICPQILNDFSRLTMEKIFQAA